MSNEVIKLGVLGCANIAEKYVLPAIKDLPKYFSLYAIASRDINKAEYFSKKFSTLTVDSYDRLVSMEDVDAIYIPLPNALHYSWIKKALENKKHVLVEKSMACSPTEVIELNEIAKNNKLVLVENFQFRFHAQLSKIKELIKKNEIGEIRHIRSSFGFPPFTDKNNIRYSKILGGGALLDAGAYPLKIMQEIANETLFVDSATLNYDQDLEVDTWGGVQLKSRSSNIIFQGSFGFDNFYQCNLEVWGSKGLIRADRIFTCPPDLKAKIEVCRQGFTETIVIPEDNHFKNMLRYFHSLILKPENAEHEYHQNIEQSKLIHELRTTANDK